MRKKVRETVVDYWERMSPGKPLVTRLIQLGYDIEANIWNIMFNVNGSGNGIASTASGEWTSR